MESEKKTRWLALKLAVIVLAVGGAGFFLLRGSGEWKQSNAPEDAALYICVKDSHVLRVTPAGFEAMEKAGKVKAHTTEAADRSGILTLECPECGQMTAVPAQPCQKDGTVFAARLPDGQAGHCPKCGWSFYR